MVKGALQWALYTNQITLTDVFRYSNIYVQTSLTAGTVVLPAPRALLLVGDRWDWGSQLHVRLHVHNYIGRMKSFKGEKLFFRGRVQPWTRRPVTATSVLFFISELSGNLLSLL